MEEVAGKFRKQLASIRSDDALTSERMSKAASYFIPRLDGLGLEKLLAVQVDNARVKKQLKNLSGDLLPLWNAHLETLRSVQDKGFNAERFRREWNKALLDEQKPTSKRKKVKEPVEVRDVYNDNRHPELIPVLSAWRRKKADEAGVPAFHILHQKTLLGIADALPDSREALLNVHGFGPVLWEKFGEEILELLKNGRRSTVLQGF